MLPSGEYWAVIQTLPGVPLVFVDSIIVDCPGLPPPKLKVLEVSSTEVKLKFKPVDDFKADFYELRISYDKKTWYVVRTSYDATVKVKDLKPQTDYYFQGASGILPSDAVGSGGEVIKVTTKKK